MPVSADTLQALMAAGVQGEALVEIVRLIDRDMAGAAVAEESSDDRRRRLDRERKRLARSAEKADKSADKADIGCPQTSAEFCGQSADNADKSPSLARVRDNSPRLVISGTVGGGVGGNADASADDWPQPHAAIDQLLAAAASPWLDPDKTPGLITTAGRIAAWKREGASWLHDVVPVVTALCRTRRQPISTWKYFDRAIAQSIADNRQALTIPEARTHERPGQDPRNNRAARRGVWAEVLAEERGEGVGEPA